MKPLHITVTFGPEIPSDLQGPLLLAWERQARELLGLRVEVFKETKADDSKLRRAMTPIQRASL